MPLNVADIYCGAGGLSEGFRQARLPGRRTDDEHDAERFDIVYGFDRDSDAMDTYRRNHFAGLPPERLTQVAPCRNVAGLTGGEVITAAHVDSIQVVVGGPNCQGVSAMGLRNAEDPRNLMFKEFLRLVSELRPEWFVMENVPGLTHKNNRDLLREIMAELAALPGYRVEADVLLAAQFGCPQYRYRLFLIGTRTAAPIRFPNPTHAYVKPGQAPLLPALPPYLAVGDVLRDLERIPPNTTVADMTPAGAGAVVHNHVVFSLEDENRKRIVCVGEGEDWRAIPISHLPERYFATRACDQKGAYGRMAWDTPAFTITASAGNVSAGPFTHPSLNRSISVREAARLQGFTDDYVFAGEADSLYRQIGNAVPPPLARAVAEAVLYCHFRPQEAANWGHAGRITIQMLDECLAGKRRFPVLTPRFPSPRRLPRALRPPKKRCGSAEPAYPRFAERPEDRVQVEIGLLETLRREARQPGNVRAGKRARAILGYFEGKSLSELLAEAKVSRDSVEKWVNGFYANGVDGWRAYHTPLSELAAGDDELLTQLADAVKIVRAHIQDAGAEVPDLDSMSEETEEETPDLDDLSEAPDAAATSMPVNRQLRRLHMNAYLRSLIERYGTYSVKGLAELVESHLGRPVGTQYVGDLLAICDVVLTRSHANARVNATSVQEDPSPALSAAG